MTASDQIPTQRTAVVTGVGSARGIGRAVARRLAEAGWALGLVDVDGEGVRELAAEMVSDGATVVGVPTDVSSLESVTAAFAEFDRLLPPIGGLANLAGVASPVALLDLTLEQWDRVMAVNVTGSFLLTQAAARRMVEHGFGRIVHTSSITAYDGGGTFSKGGYAAAKAAVLGLVHGAARELGPYGITVNVVAPGPIDTDIMGGRLTDERKAAMSAAIPVGRVGRPDDVAAAFAYLMSEDAGYVNGATLQVDGGRYMH